MAQFCRRIPPHRTTAAAYISLSGFPFSKTGETFCKSASTPAAHFPLPLHFCFLNKRFSTSLKTQRVKCLIGKLQSAGYFRYVRTGGKCGICPDNTFNQVSGGLMVKRRLAAPPLPCTWLHLYLYTSGCTIWSCFFKALQCGSDRRSRKATDLVFSVGRASLMHVINRQPLTLL